MATKPSKQQIVVNGHTFSVDHKYDLSNSRLLGRGSYGVVATAVDLETGVMVAIKRIRPYDQDQSYSRRVLSEIRCLKSLRGHPNIISLVELSLFPQKKELYMAMELMDCDLDNVLRSNQPLSEQHYKCITKQLLEGVKAIHAANIFHRDLKPGNILISKDCRIKITDFGLARHMDGLTLAGENKENPLKETVVTQCYRCPELLIAPDNVYTSAVDMWSVGCIIGELYNRKPLFHVSHTHGRACQLKFMLDMIGFREIADLGVTVDAETAIRLNAMRCTGFGLRRLIPNASDDAMALISELLSLHPKHRPSAEKALTFDFSYIHVDSLDGLKPTSTTARSRRTDSRLPSSSSSKIRRFSGSTNWQQEDPYWLGDVAMDSYFSFEYTPQTGDELVNAIFEEVNCGGKRSDIVKYPFKTESMESSSESPDVENLRIDQLNIQSGKHPPPHGVPVAEQELPVQQPLPTRPPRNLLPNKNSNIRGRGRGGARCDRCEELGHKSADCPIKRGMVVLTGSNGKNKRKRVGSGTANNGQLAGHEGESGSSASAMFQTVASSSTAVHCVKKAVTSAGQLLCHNRFDVLTVAEPVDIEDLSECGTFSTYVTSTISVEDVTIDEHIFATTTGTVGSLSRMVSAGAAVFQSLSACYAAGAEFKSLSACNTLDDAADPVNMRVSDSPFPGCTPVSRPKVQFGGSAALLSGTNVRCGGALSLAAKVVRSVS
jgi:serine/threonine protein kinase